VYGALASLTTQTVCVVTFCTAFESVSLVDNTHYTELNDCIDSIFTAQKVYTN